MGFAQSTMRPRLNQWGKTITAPGCDDAPVVDIEIGEVAKPLTIVLPYFDNPKTLVERLRAFANLRLEAPIRMTVVDDCSELSAESALKGEFIPPNFSLYRIKEKRRWNWLAARNIGAHEAPEGSWLALTDMDHFFPFATTVAMLYGNQDAGTIYRFTRHDEYEGGPEIHPHANSWFMTRDMFFRIGGYDERLSGKYGSDGSYRRRCAATAPILIMNRPLVRKEHDGDSSTTAYGRKEAQDRDIHAMIASFGDSPPLILSFPYERVL